MRLFVRWGHRGGSSDEEEDEEEEATSSSNPTLRIEAVSGAVVPSDKLPSR